jgi:hypothetical protein
MKCLGLPSLLCLTLVFAVLAQDHEARMRAQKEVKRSAKTDEISIYHA